VKRISVITISFNQGRFLRQTLDSLIHQSALPHQLIVVDGGSTDESTSILADYERWIDVLVVGEDTGPANALNIGLRRVTGDVVLCVNAGDGLLEGALLRARAHLERFDGGHILYGDGIAIDEQDRPVRPFASTPFSARRYVLGGAVVLHQSTFYDRETIESLDGFDERNSWSWDGELLARASLAGVHLVRVRDSFGVIRIHTGAISSQARSSAAAKATSARLFVETMGRPPRVLDRVAARRYYRIEKHIRNPRYSIRRAMSSAGRVDESEWPWWPPLDEPRELPSALDPTRG